MFKVRFAKPALDFGHLAERESAACFVIAAKDPDLHFGLWTLDFEPE
jgi:hypothetical protein